jgi:hypothetical protein
MLAERVIAETEGKVVRHEVRCPSALAVHAVWILRRLQKVALLASATGSVRAVLALDS